MAMSDSSRPNRDWFRSSYGARVLIVAASVVGLSGIGLAQRAARVPPQPGAGPSGESPAAGFDKLFMHDECSGENVQSPDTCLHQRQHDKTFTFGGSAATMYDVTLRIRGLFEPTTMVGGTTPDATHPYFMSGGQNRTADYSQWHIDVSEPKQTYTLNHYPATSHTIYKEDFEATIPIRGGATILVQTIDSNDREIDNGAKGRPDRQQTIPGVADTPPDGQILRIDVVRVTERH